MDTHQLQVSRLLLPLPQRLWLQVLVYLRFAGAPSKHVPVGPTLFLQIQNLEKALGACPSSTL